jgi:hypothetical protein
MGTSVLGHVRIHRIN